MFPTLSSRQSQAPNSTFATRVVVSCCPMGPRAPPHWPAGLRYTEAYTYHTSVPADARAFIRGTATTSSHAAADDASRHSVGIRRISEAGHPAASQLGLFATKKIPPRTRIVYCNWWIIRRSGLGSSIRGDRGMFCRLIYAAPRSRSRASRSNG